MFVKLQNQVRTVFLNDEIGYKKVAYENKKVMTMH